MIAKEKRLWWKQPLKYKAVTAKLAIKKEKYFYVGKIITNLVVIFTKKSQLRLKFLFSCMKIYLFLPIYSFFTLFFIPFLPAQNEVQNAKNHIKILSEKTFWGRGYVKNGQKKASEYLAKELKKLGVKPLNNDFFQHFNMPVNTFPTPIYLEINHKKLKIGHDFIIKSSSQTAQGEGKICYLDSLFWQKDNKNETNFIQNYPIFIKIISEKSFHRNKKNALIFANKKKEKEIQIIPVFHQKYEKKIQELPQYMQEMLQNCPVKIILYDKKPVSSISLYPTNESVFELKKTVFEDCFSDFKEAKNINLLTYDAKNRVKNDIFFQIKNKFFDKYPCQNVIGYTEGTSKKDSFLVLSAHYDHLGGMGQAFFAGASDNASGVGMVLGLAEYFQKNPPKYNIVYMFFGAEEAGIIGSNYYVNNPIFPLNKIKLLLNLDLMATGSMGFTLVNGTIFKDFFDKMVRLNDRMKAVPKVHIRGKAMNSDHYFFSEKGVPAFFLYTMGGKIFYHDVDDTFESLPFEKFEEIFKLICAYFEEM